MFLSKPQHSINAIEYYLEKEVPKNIHINILNPQKILTETLPKIAKQKNCTMQTNDKEFLKIILQNKLYAEKTPELTIIEFNYLTEQGGLIRPINEKIQTKILGVSSINNRAKHNQSKYDFIKTDKIITEIGTHNPENLIHEINVS